MTKPKYIDLFAGCGGLSLGLERAGWALDFAVEKSPMAAETFFYNLISGGTHNAGFSDELTLDLTIDESIKRGLLVGPVSEILGSTSALKNLENRDVALMAGGPPCQGFSLAGTRNAKDSRNDLPWEFVDLVGKVKPTFVVMENVLGINSKFSNSEDQSVYQNLAVALSHAGDRSLKSPPSYIVQKIQANAQHYGAAQTRPRLLLVACEVNFAAENEIFVTDDIWKSNFIDKLDPTSIPTLAPTPTQIGGPVTVAEALSDLINHRDSKYTSFLKDPSVWEILPSRQMGNMKQRSHGSRAILKFALYQKLKELDLPKSLLKDLGDDRHIIEEPGLEKLDYPLTLNDKVTTIRNPKEFVDLLISHKTRKHSQRVLDLDLPAPTVVTAADDYIHPVEPRVLTVRELARFQGFPDSFEFRSKETTGGLKRRTEVPQYSQVGNAVSPFLSYAIGKKLLGLLS